LSEVKFYLYIYIQNTTTTSSDSKRRGENLIQVTCLKWT